MDWKLKKKHAAVLERETGYVKKVWGTYNTVCLAYPNYYRTGMAILASKRFIKYLMSNPPSCVREYFCRNPETTPNTFPGRQKCLVWKIRNQ